MAVALIVEDEWHVRLQLAETLVENGWTVLEASTGEDALLLLKSEPKIDLLLTDVRLPGTISGWDIADAVRAERASIAVIYCSGNPNNPSRQVPGSVYLSKPTRTDVLIETCRRLCADVL
ncbi:MAG TPA: response regulator [Rhizomicrobium sp.]|nr:response regulator [Rhizomicrobium sp.]